MDKPMRYQQWWLVFLLALLALLPLLLPLPTEANSAEPVYFRVGFTNMPETFVIEITDQQRIAEAREILATDTRKLIIGKIVKQPANYNPPWSYHLDPASISFADGAIEVCDAAPAYIEAHLDEVGGAFLPDNVWCPWSSQLEAEVTPTQLFLPLNAY